MSRTSSRSNPDASSALWYASPASDQYTTGTESFSFNSQSGARYVVVLTGYGTASGNYNVTINLSSP